MSKVSTFRHAMIAGAVALALGTAGACYADDSTNSKTSPNATAPATATTTTGSSTQMTGKDKATAIGAGSGAVAGALVGGPVGAVVGAGVGAYVGHKGTDANGHVSDKHWSKNDDQVRRAQSALNDKCYNVSVDGRMGPNTESAVRSFQEKNGIAQSGSLDDATLNALGVKS